MKILVIGSKGFIGSHVFDFYKKAGLEVIGCDVVTDYESDNYIQIDATNSDFHSIFEHNKVDVCVNCSGAASVPQSLENPYRDYVLNTVNVFKLLDGIRQYQPQCKFLNLSSAAIYGNPESLPIREDAVSNPLSPYGLHKMQSEQICKEFFDYYNIKTCSVRIFSAYGAGLKKQLFWDMHQKFVNDETIYLFGTGNETRDFIFICDVVIAIHCIIKNGAFGNEIINVANGEEYTIEYVANTFKKLLHSNKNILFNKKIKPGDPFNWQADISLITSMGYTPSVMLEEGISKYIQWLKG